MKNSRASHVLSLALALGLSGCALRAQNSAPTTADAPAKLAQAPRCGDRVDRARVGGLTGSVLGTIATAVFGSSSLGFAYKGAGYVMGFASGSPCAKAAPVPEAPSAAQPQPIPVARITEEDI